MRVIFHYIVLIMSSIKNTIINNTNRDNTISKDALFQYNLQDYEMELFIFS